ncbi:MAG: hypothetical protein JSU98_08285 [Gemmatimonadales bacterium]|nr:MAG: hypothetical protein JSU98_08285 [Gemmatimonadales bacterium]
MSRAAAPGTRMRIRWGQVPAAVLMAMTGGVVPGVAQAPTFSSTLRYGSGYFDVPAAVVLPSLAFRASWSGFLVRVDADPEVDGNGAVEDPGAARSSFHGDGAFSVGLWDRLEVGATLQSFAGTAQGGTQAGLFGKALLLNPARSGLGLAVGARYLNAPTGEGGVELAPARLGFGDPRLRASFDDGRSVDTRLTVYGVASVYLPGIRFAWLPDNQVSLSAGYGSGMFREGSGLPWYAPEGTGGWFFGGGWEVQTGSGAVVALRAEHNGFDVNAGVEVAWGGLRVGVHGLGLNHGGGTSVYRSRKAGFSASVTACPLLKRACRPSLRVAFAADTVRLPAPPPDTVVIVQGSRRPASVGRPRRLCLSSGEDLWVLIPAAEDTLTQGIRAWIESLPPGVIPAGRYAEAAGWYAPGAELELPAGVYRPEGDPISPGCAEILPWVEYQGVPLFRFREAQSPPSVLLLPVAPGIWQLFRHSPGGSSETAR